MSSIGHFFNNPPNSLLIWLPMLFFGAIVYLLWRTISLMPRVQPAPIEAQSRSSRSAGPTSPASRR